MDQWTQVGISRDGSYSKGGIANGFGDGITSGMGDGISKGTSDC